PVARASGKVAASWVGSPQRTGVGIRQVLQYDAVQLVRHDTPCETSTYMQRWRFACFGSNQGGDVYQVGEDVLLRNPDEDGMPFVARLRRLWQRKSGAMLVSHNPCSVEHG